MWRKFLNWFSGYLYVCIRGNAPERFINLCSNRKLYIWNISRNEEDYRFYISIKNYKKIVPIIRKTRIVPKIIKKKGLPFFLHHNRRRKGFFAGVLICSFLIYLMSLFIWDINLVGGAKYTSYVMLKFLSEKNVHTGMRKSKVDCQEIEENIRLQYKDIGWVSAEVKGNRLIVKITETDMPVPSGKAIKPSHIVASKDAVVNTIFTRNGTPMVKPGDVVKKGQIMVSGIVDIKGDFDDIIDRKPIVASASIRCRSYYDYSDSFSLKYIKKVFTDKKIKAFYITMFGKKLFLYNPGNSYKNYDIMVDENTVHITDSFYLPFRYGTVLNREYKEEERVYTEEEATMIARHSLDRYIGRLNHSGISIIENNVKTTIENNSCITKGRILVEEPAWEYREIQENEWRIEQTDEHNGDNN